MLGDEYKELSARVVAGQQTDLDPYAATNPSEFFAVVTEAFFESPERLRKRHPAMYAELVNFYRQDPAELAQPKNP